MVCAVSQSVSQSDGWTATVDCGNGINGSGDIETEQFETKLVVASNRNIELVVVEERVIKVA